MLYSALWNDIKDIVDPYAEESHTYEFCKSGHVHLHGMIRLRSNFQLIPIGGISDIVKKFCRSYTVHVCAKDRNSPPIRYCERSIFYLDNVYKAPAICVRYRGVNEDERMKEWLEYMYKCV